MSLCGKNYPYLLQPITDLLRSKYIPAITGLCCTSDLLRELLIIDQNKGHDDKIIQVEHSTKADVHKSKQLHYLKAASTLKETLASSLTHGKDLSQEKVAFFVPFSSTS